jgi:long-chain acyl-CoA synthetase
MVTVPVYDSLGKNAAQYIVNHAEVQMLFVSLANYPNSVAIVPEIPTVRSIVVLANTKPSQLECPLPVRSAAELLEVGSKTSEQNDPAGPDDLGVIMYTSGSTGTPKGCVLTCRSVVAGGTSLGTVNASVTDADTHMSFLPLAHIYAMAVELVLYAQGGRVGFARGSVRDLIADIQALQPTILIAVPRILNKVCETMKGKIAQKPRLVQGLLRWAINRKVQAMRRNEPHSLVLDGLLFSAFRDALGGRVRVLISGGAPILQDVFEFLTAAVTPNIIQGYGLTEVCAGGAVQEMPATDPQTVGPSGLCCEVKLRKVEGTLYDPRGEVPAGELLIRGDILFQGYYKQAELTEQVLQDGWFATGDIVCLTPSGEIQIIDRVKQLVKLSQGEYLSLTSLNDYYARADVASFVYVYANSRYDQPVAVVFPKPEKIEQWREMGITNVRDDERVQKEVMDSLMRVFQERKLRGFERIGAVLVDTEEPTIENGLLTPSMKPQFASFRKRYEDDLIGLYETLARQVA